MREKSMKRRVRRACIRGVKVKKRSRERPKLSRQSVVDCTPWRQRVYECFEGIAIDQ